MLDRASPDAVAGAGAHLASHPSVRLGARVANAAEEDLAAVSGIGPRLAAFIRKRASLDAAEDLRRAAAVGARVRTWLDAGYPARLRDLQDAPPVVYLRGVWDGTLEPAVAIVGTRRPSAYGLDAAGGLGEALGEAGVVVISGLARGIDRAAHAGAPRRGGKTVAVLGCGVDIVYTREHRTLTVL
jgi:DNA processing protein